MVKYGTWSVSLDNGLEERQTEIDGKVRLEVGEILDAVLYGRRWKITHVNADALFARAVPVDASM